MEGQKNTGIEEFAHMLDMRMEEHSERPLVLDLGTIKKDRSLVTDTFPVPIPKSEYDMCANYKEVAKPGDRVLVAWTQDDPVVIDVVVKA